MIVAEILRGLDDTLLTAEVEAVTPHGTHTFAIVAIEGDLRSPVLRLVEVER